MAAITSFFIALSVLFSGCKAVIEENPENIIIVIVKGMTFESVASARFHESKNKGDVDYLLSFEKFSYYGSLKTYYGDFKRGNAFSGAAALFLGTYEPTSGSCNGTRSFDNVETIMSHAQKNNKSTGLVTTMGLRDTLTEMLIGIFHGSESERCPRPEISNCSNLSDFVGMNMDVMIGTREGQFKNYSNDDVNSLELIDCLKMEDLKNGNQKVLLDDLSELENNIAIGDKVLGLFPDFSTSQNNGTYIKNFSYVVGKAIQKLKHNGNGYILAVIVDHGSMNERLRITSHLVDDVLNSIDRKNTLVIVTSDHADISDTCTHVSEEQVAEELFEDNTTNNIDLTTVESEDINASTGKMNFIPTTEQTDAQNSTKDGIDLDTTVETADVETTDDKHTDVNTPTESLEFSTSTAEKGSNCFELSSYNDVPLFISGPYPGKMGNVQDQALFGKRLIELIEDKKISAKRVVLAKSESQFEDEFETESEGLLLENAKGSAEDLFQRGIKEALAGIDDMKKKFFENWIYRK